MSAKITMMKSSDTTVDTNERSERVKKWQSERESLAEDTKAEYERTKQKLEDLIKEYFMFTGRMLEGDKPDKSDKGKRPDYQSKIKAELQNGLELERADLIKKIMAKYPDINEAGLGSTISQASGKGKWLTNGEKGVKLVVK